VTLDKVLSFSLDEAELIRRLSGRRSCPKCHVIYHAEFNPPKKAGQCDRCQVPVVMREDDKPETVLERLKVYQRETAPLLDYYRQKRLLAEVAAAGSMEDVLKQILHAIGDLPAVQKA